MPVLSFPIPLKLGLIGYPLEHSLSPAIHQAALLARGIPGEYQLYPIPPLPEGAEMLDKLLNRLRRSEIHGLNVTIPHKQAVLDRLDDLTRDARLIGAANTLYARGSQIIGHNTDGLGFRLDLHTLGCSSSTAGDALVLGAGGSACAVVSILLSDGWRVTLASRRLEQASQLAARYRAINKSRQEQILPAHLQVIELKPAPLALYLSQRDAPRQPLLVVNTTPVGMAPHVDDSPWPAEIPLPEGAYIYDLVYNPAETRLVRAARQAGLLAANGLGMLVQQAALSFERWTGQDAPLQMMVEAATAALACGSRK